MKRYLALAAAMTLTMVDAPARAKPRYGGLTVTANAPGAQVSLGRRTWPLPKTFWLRRGSTYELKATAPGYQDKVERVTVTRARGALEIKLDPVTAKLSVVSEDDSAIGALLRANGEPAGSVPTTVEVKPGRLLLEAQRDGHAPWSRWVEATSGKTVTVAVKLERIVGRLVVSATPATARVKLDGVDRGAVPLTLDNVPAGNHVVAVSADGHAPATRAVLIRAGDVARVQAQLEPLKKAQVGGVLHVLTEPESVDIYVDGKFRGKAPVKATKLASGTHILSVRWPGYRTVEREVAIEGDRVTTVKIKLTKETAAPVQAAGNAVSKGGNLLVASTIRGSAVFLDGALIGQTPHAQVGLAPGTYRVKVLAPGHQPVVETVRIFSSRTVRVTAMLQSEAPAAGAAAAGSAPAPVATVHGEEAVPTGASPVSVRGLTSFGANLVPPRHFTGDMGFGFPYVFEGRLLTGVFERGHFALDTGVEFRTNGSFNEGGLIGRFRFLRYSPFAAAAFLQLGGGGGSGSRNTFYADLGAAGSIRFRDLVTFTASFYANFYTDRLCPGTPQSGELDACIFPPAGLSYTGVRDRIGGARFMMSAAVDLALTDHIGAFLMVEGAPFQNERWAYTDRFVALMPKTDPRFYGRGGLTFKF